MESVHVLFSSALSPSRPPPRVARRSRDRSDFLTYETPQRGLPLWADDAGHEFALGRRSECSGAISLLLRFADDETHSDLCLVYENRMANW